MKTQVHFIKTKWNQFYVVRVLARGCCETVKFNTKPTDKQVREVKKNSKRWVSADSFKQLVA